MSDDNPSVIHASAHDTGSMAHDTGSMAHNIGSMAHDTGSTAHDTGSTARDTGSTAHDTGSMDASPADGVAVRVHLVVPAEGVDGAGGGRTGQGLEDDGVSLRRAVPGTDTG